MDHPSRSLEHDSLAHKAQAETHEVFNQPTPLEHYNAYTSDNALQFWITKFGGDWASSNLRAYGDRCGNELQRAGFLANENKPQFDTHDRFGHRVDLVRFHPAYHELMHAAVRAGIHASPWRHPIAGAHVARAGLMYLHTQAEAGTCCPITMTFAAVPALKSTPSVAAEWLPKILSDEYDERNVPYTQKNGVTIGMAMTEKQGGSDVRANTTRAYPLGEAGPGEAYEIVGHKWFCSAPMSDAFLVLAQTESGLSCFLLPRWRPDGNKNAMHIQRLKNKLGNCSNASSEVEYRGAFAWMLGEEGRGVRTIIDMVAMTRFDCMIGSSGLMRAAVAQATHHTSGRSVFGKNLHKQPLMQNVLADLALESEAALALTMRLAHSLDQQQDEAHQLFARLVTAIGKYWICKRAPHLTYEAMECIGGVGYVEENLLPRLYREAPVNAIWEGSGNVQCLDVLRATDKSPAAVEVLFNELNLVRGQSVAFDQQFLQLQKLLKDPTSIEANSRFVVDKLAVLLQAATLMQSGESLISDAFVAARVEGQSAFNYGSLLNQSQSQAIMQRAQPHL
ncbi:isovaleryl-CoA dehydrogenase [Permianibacter aggregans]|uniref:Putative acyl-CoA dehydrogenase n=1 Tax=Permianibacter aggregans TaxID=1510150 RepID=A0A4R6UJL1_9GAMM|nr:isovaleryl-CoA dehydrogenase [Permianibacter aggregans]TDQ43394.1 putative acyl-CoA dehydrogenase [Permianibacter aggregans]